MPNDEDVLDEDQKELRRLLNRAIDRRVSEILRAIDEERRRRGVSHPSWAEPASTLGTLRERLRLLRHRERVASRLSPVWEWVKAVGLLLAPGVLLSLMLFPVLRILSSVTLADLLIYLSLQWR